MVAVALLHGRLAASDYEDDVAGAARIDALRGLMRVVENEAFSAAYLDPEKRSIANSLQVFFDDGTSTEKITVEYPIGHRRRRKEAIPMLLEKLRRNVSTRYDPDRAQRLEGLFLDLPKLEAMPIDRFMQAWAS
jgi:2-methylcitrate dehydratase PrpD